MEFPHLASSGLPPSENLTAPQRATTQRHAYTTCASLPTASWTAPHAVSTGSSSAAQIANRCRFGTRLNDSALAVVQTAAPLLLLALSGHVTRAPRDYAPRSPSCAGSQIGFLHQRCFPAPAGQSPASRLRLSAPDAPGNPPPHPIVRYTYPKAEP